MSDNIDEPSHSTEEYELHHATAEELPFYRAMYVYPFPSKGRGDARSIFADWLEERGECKRAEGQRSMARVNYDLM